MSPQRYRIILVAAGPLVLGAVASVALYLAWLPRLPERLGSHVGEDGRADGFVDTGTFPWTLPLFTLAIAVMFAGMAGGAANHTTARRLFGACGVGTAGLMIVSNVMVLSANLDVTDPAAVRFPMWLLGVMAAATVTGAALGWFTAGRAPEGAPREAAPEAVRPVRELGPTESVEWHRSVTSSESGWLALTLAPLGAWTVWATGGWGVLIFAPVLLILLAFTRGEVTITDSGLSLQMIWGLMRIRIPATEIRMASSQEIDAMRDFQGWGWRSTAKATGMIFRSGPALWIDRKAYGMWVVTVPDADEAAALLNGLRQRVSSG